MIGAAAQPAALRTKDRQLFEPDKYGFALHPDNRLTKSITTVLLRLKEEGVVEDLRRKYFGE